jgi:hypothetical protein
LIFAKPESQSEAARMAPSETAVAIAWQRLAFGVRRLAGGPRTRARHSRTTPRRLQSTACLSQFLSAKIYGPARR